MQRQYTTSFHLILSPEDLCDKLDCKWCKGMRVIYKLESQRRAFRMTPVYDDDAPAPPLILQPPVLPVIVDGSRQTFNAFQASNYLLHDNSINPSPEPTHRLRHNTPVKEAEGQTHKITFGASPFKQSYKEDNIESMLANDSFNALSLSESPRKLTASRLNIHAREFSLNKHASSDSSSKRTSLDVNAPVFVPSTRHNPLPQERINPENDEMLIYSSIKHPYTSLNPDLEFKSQARLAYDFPCLHPHAGLDNAHRYARMLFTPPEGVSNRFPLPASEETRDGHLEEEEAIASMTAHAWEMAMTTYQQALRESVPGIVEHGYSVLAHSAAKRIAQAEDVIAKMKRDALEGVERMMSETRAARREEEIVEMRMKTIAAALEMKRKELEARTTQHAQRTAEERGLYAGLEKMRLRYVALEDELKDLRVRTAQLWRQTTMTGVAAI